MQVLYSIELESVEDVHIQNIIKVLKVLSEASRPIAYLIDSIPLSMTLSPRNEDTDIDALLLPQ